ncbi:hypothetical protein NL676_034022 [Syzygium grande]|nr:hypothetical protein NL676_034022 [Syzygium grande]
MSTNGIPRLLLIGCCRPCCRHGHKNSWPELVGQDADKAKAIIEKDNPWMKVVPLPARSVRPDYSCCDRVYLLVDENGNVTEVPIAG